MKIDPRFALRISRRDTLRMCLVPAGAALGSRLLIGCGGDDAGSTINPQAAGTGASPAGGTGASSAAAGTGTPVASGAAGTGSAAGSTAKPPAAGTGAVGSAGSGTAPAGTGAVNAGAGGASAAGSAGSAAAGSGVAAGSGGAGGAIAGAGVSWATGGTGSMTGNYPDPFAGSGAGTMCTVYPTQTLGPCYAMGPDMREDISDGMTGLPVRLSFLLVKQGGCTPVSGATIDIWHSGFDGIYSDYATGTICNPGTMTTQMQMFCRGVQMTDTDGRCNFSTIFPGWYRGRTIHIHFTVRINGRDTVTSQLYFEDELSNEILAQGEYKPRGMRDTTNADDNTFRSGGATAAQVLMTHEKRPDGVLHAWKVLAVA